MVSYTQFVWVCVCDGLPSLVNGGRQLNASHGCGSYSTIAGLPIVVHPAIQVVLRVNGRSVEDGDVHTGSVALNTSEMKAVQASPDFVVL